MSKTQSFILDDPDAAIFHGERAQDSRIVLSLTPYDLRVIAQMLALAAYPEDFRDKPGSKALQETSTKVGALILGYLDDVWAGLTPAEQELGTSHTVEYDE